MKPTGTGPFGQSGVEPSGTISRSFNREFIGRKEASMTKDRLANKEHHYADDKGRVYAIECTYKGCNGQAYYDAADDTYGGDAYMGDCHVLAFSDATPRGTVKAFVAKVDEYLNATTEHPC